MKYHFHFFIFEEKTMKHFIFILIAVLAFSTSCKKKDLSFVLKGNITALNTGANVKGVSVKIFADKVGSSTLKLVDEVKTDASGNFEISIDRSRFENLTIQLSKDKYFTQRNSYLFDKLSTANDNVFNYKISPKSWTKFVFKNIPPANPSDELKVQKVSGKTDCEDCCENGFYFYNGLVDTTVICPNDGDTYMKFYYWVNGDVQHGIDSVYNLAFDTVTYELTY